MKLKRLAAASLIAVTGLAFIPSSAAAAGCSNGPIATLYRKLTGDELIYCP